MNREDDDAEQDLRNAEHYVKQRGWRPRDPRRMSNLLSQVMSRKGYAEMQGADELQELWKSAVGQRIAALSHPTRIRRNVLEVLVENSAVMQELTFLKSKLIKKLKQTEYCKKISDVRFKVGS